MNTSDIVDIIRDYCEREGVPFEVLIASRGDYLIEVNGEQTLLKAQ